MGKIILDDQKPEKVKEGFIFGSLIHKIFFSLLLIILFLIIRIPWLTLKPIWADESLSLIYSQNLAFEYRSWSDPHPPGYYFILSLIIHYYGPDIFVLRLFSSLCLSFSSVIIFWELNKRVGFWWGIWGWLSFSFNVIVLRYSMEIRMYSLDILLFLSSSIYFIKILSIPNTTNYFLYIFFTILLIWVEYLSLPFVIAEYFIYFVNFYFGFKKKTKMLNNHYDNFLRNNCSFNYKYDKEKKFLILYSFLLFSTIIPWIWLIPRSLSNYFYIDYNIQDFFYYLYRLMGFDLNVSHFSSNFSKSDLFINTIILFSIIFGLFLIFIILISFIHLKIRIPLFKTESHNIFYFLLLTSIFFLFSSIFGYNLFTDRYVAPYIGLYYIVLTISLSNFFSNLFNDLPSKLKKEKIVFYNLLKRMFTLSLFIILLLEVIFYIQFLLNLVYY